MPLHKLKVQYKTIKPDNNIQNFVPVFQYMVMETGFIYPLIFVMLLSLTISKRGKIKAELNGGFFPFLSPFIGSVKDFHDELRSIP